MMLMGLIRLALAVHLGSVMRRNYESIVTIVAYSGCRSID